MNNIYILIIAAYLAINLYATIKTIKITEHTDAQKIYQLLIIWCIPFLGGLTMSLIQMIRPGYDSGSYDVGAGDYSDGEGSGDGG